MSVPTINKEIRTNTAKFFKYQADCILQIENVLIARTFYLGSDPRSLILDLGILFLFVLFVTKLTFPAASLCFVKCGRHKPATTVGSLFTPVHHECIYSAPRVSCPVKIGRSNTRSRRHEVFGVAQQFCSQSIDCDPFLQLEER